MTSRRGFKVLITVVSILLVFALVTAGNPTIGGIVTGFILTPLRKVAADFTNSAVDTITPPKSVEELEAENSALTAENRRLNDMLVEYYDLKKENEELYQFYNIKKNNEDFSIVPVTVISRDPNENFCGFIVDKGTMDGISLNDPVMTENGLIGYISEVSLKSAKVTTILSPEVQIGVVDKRTGDEGIICGEPTLSDSGMTIMKNISSRNTIKSGDIIVTSGYGGLYPKNIKLGTVSYLTLDSYTGTPVAVIKPFEEIASVTSAAIVVNFSGKGEVEEYSREESSKSS